MSNALNSCREHFSLQPTCHRDRIQVSLRMAACGLLSFALNAATVPPLIEDGSRGGLGTVASWSFASNNAGRITLPGTVLDRFDQTGTPFFSSSFFRGNLYHADAACTLLGHEFYLERNTPVEVTFSVYEGATAAGPFIRVDEVTVLAPAGTGYVASGQRGVTLRAGYTYAVGAAVAESAYFQRPTVTLPFDNGDLSCVNGLLFSGLPGATVSAFSTATNPYRQRLRLGGPSDVVPGGTTLMLLESVGMSMRGNLYAPSQNTWLLGHGLYVPRGSDRTMRLFVYESAERTGTYARVDMQTVTVPAGTNYIAVSTRIPMQAGRFYMIGAWGTSYSCYRASGYYATPQDFSWGRAVEGYSSVYLLNGPPDTFVKSSTTNTTVYWGCVTVGDLPALRMDTSVYNQMSTNSATVLLDTQGYDNLYLAFDHREAGDEAHDGDGVFVSSNGTSFRRILQIDTTSSGWTRHEIDLIPLARAAGVPTDGQLHVRFQQMDNYPWTGGDGREFSGILFHAKPDFGWYALDTTQPKYLFRGKVAKTFSLSGTLALAGGTNAVADLAINTRYRLNDPVGPVQTTYDALSLDLPALGHRHMPFGTTVTVPASTTLTQSVYQIHVDLDYGAIFSEGNESNNTDRTEFLVNHYAGTLRFGTVSTFVTLSDWDFQVGYGAPLFSPERHVITGNGTVAGQSFSFTNLKVRKDPITGIYSVDPAETQTITLYGLTNTLGSVSGVRFRYNSPITLSKDGAQGIVSALMPAGCAFAARPDMPWGMPFTDAIPVWFNSLLYPTGILTTAPPYGFFFEESKPLYFDVTSLQWDTAAGRLSLTVADLLYAHAPALDELEALKSAGLISSQDALRRSNDGYYRTAAPLSGTVQVTPDSAGAAQLDFAVSLKAGAFVAHMPYDVAIDWRDTGHLAISNDLPVVDPAASVLNDGQDMLITYNSGCPGGCVGGDMILTQECYNAYAAFFFTQDGGLFVPCEFRGVEAEIHWGYIASLGRHAQNAFGFREGVFHMPGHFLKRADCPPVLSADDTPGALLLTGVERNGDELIRPHGQGYAEGDGAYAGLTVAYEGPGCEGTLLLGGSETLGPFRLDEACKLYVRHSGVTGIQLADETLGSSSVMLYGYPFRLNYLAFAYLSNQNTDSRSNGDLFVPAPTDFNLAFDRLNLNCFGDVESLSLPSPAPELTLAYWSARVKPTTALFTSTDPCAVGQKTLVMDISTEVDNLPGRLFGRIGVLANGNLACSNDMIGCDSRLTLPASVTLPGPNSASYTLRPASKGYFNDFRTCGDRAQTGDGLLTFAGEIDVPFFENLLVQGFTGADTGGATSPLYLVGGWPTKGWKIGSDTPFTDPEFDTANAAHPTGTGKPPFSEYLAGSHADYIPRARREWISGIGFDIGVRWDAPTRSFRSPAPNTRDLFVVQTEYNVPQLTPQRAEITFGLQYGEMPALNLSSVFFNAVDEATGISACFTSVVGNVVNSVMDRGIDALETVTATDPAELLANTLASEIDPFVDSLYVALSNAHASGSSSVSNVLARYVRGGAGAPAHNLRHILDTLVDGSSVIEDGIGLADDLQARIDEAEQLINAVAFTVDDPVMGTADGLLNKLGDDYPLLETLGRILMIFAIPSMMDADSAIEDTLGTVMESIEPALDTIKETLGEVQTQLADVRSTLEEAGEFRNELAAFLDPAQLQAVADAIASQMESELGALEGAFSPYANYTQDEIKALLRAAIVDALRSASPIAELQRVVRARMLDFDRQIREGVSSVMAQVNTAMRETLSEMVGSLDDTISGMTGDLSDVIGTGQIEGYAHISGDSLDKLRLDLLAQMKVPEELEFKGYLEIVNEQATASAGCAFPDGDTYKVTLGAQDVACDWLGSDARINCACFFTINSGTPKGLGGGIELVGGKINFEAMEVERFGAAVAFGLLENYLAAAARVTTPAGVEIEGGVFFGRTCTLDPLLIVDPECGTVFGEPPFTGAYVYGEGWMPIYDYGCLFSISAGAGLGVFYFMEGPTYGVRVMLGASGEALCVVSVRGEIEVYGLKQGDAYRARGKGKVKGKVGCCPFCVKFNKTVTVTYDDGEWDVDY